VDKEVRHRFVHSDLAMFGDYLNSQIRNEDKCINNENTRYLMFVIYQLAPKCTGYPVWWPQLELRNIDLVCFEQLHVWDTSLIETLKDMWQKPI
jgi:hypothetical protein